MAKFKYYKRGECPICGGAGHKSNKQCRSTELDDGRLKVHCWGGGDAPQGWGYVGDDAHGMAMYVEGWRDRKETDWAEIERRKAEKAAQRRLESQRRSMPKQRHEIYSKWQDSQRLAHRDRQELERRGLLPSEIQMAQDLGWLRRWQNGSPLHGADNIPGASAGGLYGATGMAIAAPNVDGLIAGFQIKPDIVRGDDPKYRWLKGCILRNDEQPMPVFRHPNHRGDVEIWVAEGFLKPLVTALRVWRLGLTHIVVVGSGGSNWDSAKSQWEYTLRRLKPSACYLLPDAGAALNPNIRGEAGKLQSLMERLGHCLQVKWWGQLDKEGKGKLDPDEVPTQTILESPALPALPSLAIQHWSQTPQRMAQLVPGIGMPLIYEKGDRLKTWERLRQKSQGGGLAALDKSPPGSGKTRAAGQYMEGTPKGTQCVFASNEYRNPSDPSLASFPELESKHHGLMRVPLEDGTEIIRNAPKGTPNPDTPASCEKPDFFHTANALGITQIAGKDCIGCQTCPAAQITREMGEIKALTCAHLDRKRETKAEPAYRCHPLTIAAPPDDFGMQTVVIDEASQALQISRPQNFDTTKLSRDFEALKQNSPAIATLIEPILDAILAALPKLAVSQSPEDHFGVDANRLREQMAPAIAETESRLDAYLASPRFDMAPGCDSWAWLINRVDRAAFKLRDIHYGESEAEQIWALKELGQSRAIAMLLKALKSTAIVPTLTRGTTERGNPISKLRLSLKSTHPRRVAQRRDRFTLLLDATANPGDMARMIGAPIFWIQERRPRFENLQITLITGTDKFCIQREAGTVDQRAALLAKAVRDRHKGESLAILDYQRFHPLYEGMGATLLARHVDSRGTNRAKDADALLIMGRPVRNLGQLEIEYELLYGRSPDGFEDRRFQAFLNRSINGDLIQELSRLRAQWGTGQKHAYIAGAGASTKAALAIAFPGATIIEKSVMQIEPQAAGEKSQRTAHTIVDAAIGMVRDGVKVTRAAIATATEKSPATVTNSVKAICGEGFRAFVKRLETLYKTLYRGIDLFENPDLEALRQGLDIIGCGHYFAAVDAADTVAALEAQFKRYGEKVYLEALGRLSPYGFEGIQRAIATIAITDAAESPPPPAERTPAATAIA